MSAMRMCSRGPAGKTVSGVSHVYILETGGLHLAPDAGEPVARWQVNFELYGDARLIQCACVYASESATMDVRRELHNRFGGPPVLAEGSAIQGPRLTIVSSPCTGWTPD